MMALENPKETKLARAPSQKGKRRFGTDITNVMGDNQQALGLLHCKSSSNLPQEPKLASKLSSKGVTSENSQCGENSTHMMIECTPLTNPGSEGPQGTCFHSAQLNHHFGLAAAPGHGPSSREIRQSYNSEEAERLGQPKKQKEFLKNRPGTEKMMEERASVPQISSTNRFISSHLASAHSAPNISSIIDGRMQCEQPKSIKNSTDKEDQDNVLEVAAFDEKNRHLPNSISEFLPSIFSFLRSSEVPFLRSLTYQLFCFFSFISAYVFCLCCWKATLYEKQGKNVMKSDYMRTFQNDISEKMRSILIDWLVDVHLKFKLKHETLFIMVNIIDRFLELHLINRGQLQLVGISALLIACKYEEIYSPEIKDLVYVTDHAYSREEVLQMEGLILSTLGFNLTAVSPLTFLERYADVSQTSEVARSLAKYILEFSLQNFKANIFLPSVRGSAALCLSRRWLGYEKPWPDYLEAYSKHSEAEMEVCLNVFAYTLINSEQCKLRAVKNKYSAPAYNAVAQLCVSS